MALVDISNEVAAREKLSLALLSLQTVFDAIPGGIAVFNNDYYIVNINHRLLKLHDLNNKDAVLGKTCFDIFGCGSQPCVDCPLDEVRQKGTTLIRTIYKNDSRFPDGAYQVYYSPIYDVNGSFNGMVEVVMDISDLRKAEDALAASEQKFEELFNDIPDAVFITKVGENSGNIIDCNPAAEKQTGYSRDELLRMNILKDISMLKTDEQITSEREINLLNREKIELTEQKRRKDGTLIWTEVVVQRIEINGVYCALSVSRDITERKSIEENLKNSRNRIMSILDAIPDILFILNQDGVFLEYHANNAGKLYLPPEMFLNKKADNVMPEYLARLTNEKIKETLQTGLTRIYNYELEIMGETHYFESRMVKNSANTVLTIVRDVSDTVKAGHDKRKNEEKYKAMFINSPIGVLNFDQQGIIHDCNEIFVQTIGSAREALIGFNMLEQLQNQGVKAAIKNAIGKGSGFYEGYYNSITANKVTPVKAYFKCIYDDNEEFVDGIGLIEDITEQKKYEQELVEARKLAEQSDRLKSSFMATMSHELRTPLNTVIGFADMMDQSLPADQVIEFAQVISKSGKHLLDIIEDILDISLIDSGEVKLSHERLNLGDYADALLNTAQQEKLISGKTHLSVQLSIPANMRNLTIIGDTHKLNKLFSQIIKNAFKFTKEGAVEIGISKKPETDDSPNIVFYIKDTGIGISKEQQEYIFDVFRQVDDSTTREFEGTGLGLAISKKLVELMKGKILVESELGKGSIFLVELPCLQIAGNNYFKIESVQKIPHEQNSKIQKLAMIAEKDDLNFHLYKLLLQRRNIGVVNVKNSSEAISMVKQNPSIKIMLLDLNMPEMGGMETIAKIKHENPELPIIALTVTDLFTENELVIKAGCDDIISKPINNQLFVKTVMKFL
jgi:PAS domain S-box-containing protein